MNDFNLNGNETYERKHSKSILSKDDDEEDVGRRIWSACRSDMNTIIEQTCTVLKYVKDLLIKGWTLNIDKVIDPTCTLSLFISSCNKPQSSQQIDNNIDENNNLYSKNIFYNNDFSSSNNNNNSYNLEKILDMVISSMRLISESPNKHFLISGDLTHHSHNHHHHHSCDDDSDESIDPILTFASSTSIINKKIGAWCTGYIKVLGRLDTFLRNVQHSLTRTNAQLPASAALTLDLCSLVYRIHNNICYASPATRALCDSDVRNERMTTVTSSVLVMDYARQSLAAWDSSLGVERSGIPYVYPYAKDVLEPLGQSDSADDTNTCTNGNGNDDNNSGNGTNVVVVMDDDNDIDNSNNNDNDSMCTPSPMPDLESQMLDNDEKRMSKHTKMPSVPPIAIKKPRSLSSSPASPTVLASETAEFGSPSLQPDDLADGSNATNDGSPQNGGVGSSSGSSSHHGRSSKHRHHRREGSSHKSSNHGSVTPVNNTVSTSALSSSPSQKTLLTSKKKRKSKTSLTEMGGDKKPTSEEKTPRTPRTPRDFWTYAGPFIGEVLQGSFILEGPLHMSVASIDTEGEVVFSSPSSSAAAAAHRWLSNRRSIQDLDIYTVETSAGKCKCGVIDVDAEPIQFCNVRRIYFGNADSVSSDTDGDVVDGGDDGGDGRSRVFYLETAKKVYRFMAHSGLEASGWVLGIKRIISAPEDGVVRHSMSYNESSTARKREWDTELRALAEASRFYSSFDFGLQIDYNFHNRCIAQIQSECDKVDEVLHKINESGDKLVQKYSFYTLRKKGLLENMREHIDRIHDTTALIEARIAATTNSQFPTLSSLMVPTAATATSPSSLSTTPTSASPSSLSTSPTSSVPIPPSSSSAAAAQTNQGTSPPSPGVQTSTSTAEGIVRAVHRLHSLTSGTSPPTGSRWTRPFRKPFFSSSSSSNSSNSSSSSSNSQKRDIGAGDWITIGDALREWIDSNPEFRLPEYPIAPIQQRRDMLPSSSSSSSMSSTSTSSSSTSSSSMPTSQGFVLSGPDGPGSAELHNGEKVACKSVTCYPLTPATIRELGSVPDGILPNDDELAHMGDPICDQFYVQSTGENIVAVLADGCNWGSGPRKAAKTAAIALGSFIKMYLGRCTNLAQFSEALILGMEYAAQKVAGGCDKIKPATTTVAGGTILDISPAGFREKYAWVGVSVGDCKVFHYSARTRIVSDITKNSRFDVNDPSDPGGRIGPYLENGKPDFRNLRICYRRCEKGDLIILATDGVHDNLDPQTLGESPRDWGLKYDTWDSANDKDPKATQLAKSQFMLTMLKRVISDKEDDKAMPAPIDVVRKLVDNAVKTTQSSRKWMNEHPKEKLPSDYVKFPGKLDHVTCVCVRVSGSYPSVE